MKILVLILVNCFFSTFYWSQEDSTSHLNSQEIGFDGFVHISNVAGTYGIGIKYAFVKSENWAFGPSLRFNRSWSNYSGTKTGFNIYGGGLFAHYRYKNLLFAGAEFEYMRSPLNFSLVNSLNSWVPTFFLGGGFSKAFEPSKIRINAGVFYDIVNHVNSPFRLNYSAKKANGALIPLIYRIGFFIRLD